MRLDVQENSRCCTWQMILESSRIGGGVRTRRNQHDVFDLVSDANRTDITRPQRTDITSIVGMLRQRLSARQQIVDTEPSITDAL